MQLLAAAESTSDPAKKADLLKEAELSKVDAPNYEERIATVLERREELAKALTDYTGVLETAAATLPEAVSDVKKAVPAHIAEVRAAVKKLETWSWQEPVSFFTAARSFFGTGWITNSSWQDF